MSEFFRKRGDDKYAECSIEPLLDEDVEEILVYNDYYVFANLLLSCIYRYGVYGIKQDTMLAVSHHSKAIKIGGADAEEMYEELKLRLFGRGETDERISALKNRILQRHCK